LSQNRYRENAQRLSRIYRDQPLTPLEQAVFWTEYVIRHKGAPHMRSAALDITWYQYFLLDVIAVLTIAVVLVLLIVFLMLRAALRKFRIVKNIDTSRKKGD
jgi:glucuronosyltransferase